MEQPKKNVQMQVKATDAVMAGSYANHLMLHMNREEFVLDFIGVVPPHATLNSRVVLSPGNLKRMLHILRESLEKYEKEFGEVVVGPPPSKAEELIQ